MLTELQNRGLRDLLFSGVDGLSVFREPLPSDYRAAMHRSQATQQLPFFRLESAQRSRCRAQINRLRTQRQGRQICTGSNP